MSRFSRAWVHSACTVYRPLPSACSAITGRSGAAMAAPTATGIPCPIAPPTWAEHGVPRGRRGLREIAQGRGRALVDDDGPVRESGRDGGREGVGGERARRRGGHGPG